MLPRIAEDLRKTNIIYERNKTEQTEKLIPWERENRINKNGENVINTYTYETRMECSGKIPTRDLRIEKCLLKKKSINEVAEHISLCISDEKVSVL